MNDQLSSLEQRIDQLLGHFTQVRGENHDLRIRVANLESENKRLRERIDSAAERVEVLIEGLPSA